MFHSLRKRPLRVVLVLSLALALAGFGWVFFRADTLREQDEAENAALPAGQEARILALFEPFQLDGEVLPGWTFAALSIEHGRLTIRLDGPKGVQAVADLVHPKSRRAEDAPVTACFAVLVTSASDPGGRAALDRMVEALRGHEQVCPWVEVKQPAPKPGWLDLLRARGATTGASVLSGIFFFVGTVIPSDALFMLLAVAVLLFVAAFRPLPGCVRIPPYALALPLLLGLALRLWLSVPVSMGPWPFERSGAGGLMAESFLFKTIFGNGLLPLSLVNLIPWATLAFAVLAPLAIYVHARYLFRDERIALAASFLLALWPNHIRFSMSEEMFIPSTLMACTSLAMIHVILHDSSRPLRLLTVLFQLVFVAAMVQMRPLNILYSFPMMALIFLLPKEPLSLTRRLSAAVPSIGTLGVVGYYFLSTHHAETVAEGLSDPLFVKFLGVVTSTTYNTLINPNITPPILMGLALVGLIWLLRKKPLLLVALLGELFLFMLCHSFIVPSQPVHQARYHLHLTVPFLLLAAASLPVLMSRRWLLAVVLVLVALGPFSLKRFIRDTDFNIINEYRFLAELAPQLPEESQIIEHTGRLRAAFPHFGLILEREGLRQRFTSLIESPDELARQWEEGETRREHVYYYEGQTCYCEKDKTEPIAPFCQQMHEHFDLEELASRTHRNRFLDENHSEGFTPGMRQLRFVLYRVKGTRTPP